MSLRFTCPKPFTLCSCLGELWTYPKRSCSSSSYSRCLHVRLRRGPRTRSSIGPLIPNFLNRFTIRSSAISRGLPKLVSLRDGSSKRGGSRFAVCDADKIDIVVEKLSIDVAIFWTTSNRLDQDVFVGPDVVIGSRGRPTAFFLGYRLSTLPSAITLSTPIIVYELTCAVR